MQRFQEVHTDGWSGAFFREKSKSSCDGVATPLPAYVNYIDSLLEPAIRAAIADDEYT